MFEIRLAFFVCATKHKSVRKKNAMATTKQAIATRNGQQIREARQQRGLSQKDVALAVGTNQQIVGKIEDGSIANSRYLLPIRQYLEIVTVTEGPRGIAHPKRPAAARNWRTFTDWAADVPVFFGDVDGSKEPPTMLLRPAPMLAYRTPDMKDSPPALYCVHVTDHAMAPRYEPGDMLYFGETPPRPETDVLLRNESDGGMMVIARLVRIMEKSWTVRRIGGSSKNEFPVSRHEYPTCHSVIWTKRI